MNMSEKYLHEMIDDIEVLQVRLNEAIRSF